MMRIFDYLINWINTTIHASFAKSSAKHCMKPTITYNGNYELDDIDELSGIHIGDVTGRVGTEGGCQIEIIGFDGSNIHAKVVACGKFWTDLNNYKDCVGITVGEEIELQFMENINGFSRWNVIKSSGFPWFSLYVDADGKKSFEHYR
jgi:hypothetical protein